MHAVNLMGIAAGAILYSLVWRVWMTNIPEDVHDHGASACYGACGKGLSREWPGLGGPKNVERPEKVPGALTPIEGFEAARRVPCHQARPNVCMAVIASE
jgi:hypothetical protein